MQTPHSLLVLRRLKYLKSHFKSCQLSGALLLRESSTPDGRLFLKLHTAGCFEIRNVFLSKGDTIKVGISIARIRV